QQYLDGISDWSRAMTRADMDRVRDDFVHSTRLAAQSGFDWLELHCAHGYLLSSFISPLTNQRTDGYGGSLAYRLRYPLEVFAAVREVWPKDLPISVRISAHDWVEGGIAPDDAVEIARYFKAAGADLIDCSSGQVSKKQQPVYGRMYQTPFADRIRNEAGIPTIAVGAISEADHVNSIIAAGRADLCAVARPHLANPAWTLLEAAKIGVTDELAGAGLVSGEASPADRRAWIVRLTPKGRSTFAAMADEHERWIRELFAGFDADAVAALHAQLGTLRVHLLDKLKPSEAE